MVLLLIVVYFIFVNLDNALSSNESFNYEKLHMFGLGRPIIQRRHRNYGYPYPEELPTKPPRPYIRPPYKNLYQGVRNKGDTRVYNKHFEYSPKTRAHHLYCEGVFDCTLTHLAVETNGSLPIIFRGGVGYKHFTVIIKAEAYDMLSGRVRAYCKNKVEKTFTIPPMC